MNIKALLDRPCSPFSSTQTEDGEDEPQDFPSVELEVAHFKAKYLDIYRTLQDTKAELGPSELKLPSLFRWIATEASSKELEEELERELASTESVQADLRAKIVRLESEKEEWKGKYLSAQKSHNLALGSLQRELDEVKAEKERYRTSLRDLEMGVDDLERNERMVSSSLSDMEARYNKAIEEKTLLEQELIENIQVEEEMQRLKDEINDLQTEVSVLKQQRFLPPPSPTRSASPPRLPSPPVRSRSRTDFSEPSKPTGNQQAFMSPVKESSRELSMSDLMMVGERTPEAQAPSLLDEEDYPQSSPERFDSVPLPPLAGPSKASRLPSSPMPRSTSSPAFARLNAGPSSSPSRLAPNSPSAFPKSTTGRNLNCSAAFASPSVASPLSPVVVRNRQPLAPRTLASNATAKTEPKSRGVRMVSDLGERVRTLQSRIQTHRDPAVSSTRRKIATPLNGLASLSRPSSRQSSRSEVEKHVANPRMRALAGEGSMGRSPVTPGTPGAGDWVLVSDAENSPTPAPPPPPSPPRSTLSNGLRKSVRSSKTTSSATSVLPSRPGIPSPLASSSRMDLPSMRPSSRLSERSERRSSVNGGSSSIPSRPITPTYLPLPRSSASSSRPSSPALGQAGPSSIHFPSSSTSTRLGSISTPRPLGMSSRNPPPSTFGSSYASSSSDASALKRSTRGTSLVEAQNGQPAPPTGIPSPAPRSRLSTGRTSLGNTAKTRPLSTPVPLKDAPPVPVVPSHLASKRHAILPSARPAMGRKRSSTGGSEGRLMGYQP